MKKHPIFQPLSEDEYKKALQYFEKRNYKEGEYLAKEGEYSSKAFILIKGKVSVIKTNNYNESYELKEISAPADEFFSEVNLIDRGLVISSILAKSDCEVLEINHDSFVEMIEKHPNIASKMLWVISYNITKHLRKADNEVKMLFNALSEVVNND
jgi:CRP-like cAMP-binding protein